MVDLFAGFVRIKYGNHVVCSRFIKPVKRRLTFATMLQKQMNKIVDDVRDPTINSVGAG